MALPQKLNLDMMQTSWAQQLNPIIADPYLHAIILKSVSLVTGTNVINHKLGRNMQGWQIVRQRSSATFYDTQDTNQQPTLTLTLVASAPCVVDLRIF
jgi:hypothetical protein